MINSKLRVIFLNILTFSIFSFIGIPVYLLLIRFFSVSPYRYGEYLTKEECIKSDYGQLSLNQAKELGYSNNEFINYCSELANQKKGIPMQYWDFHYYTRKESFSINSRKINDSYKYNSRYVPCNNYKKNSTSKAINIWMFGGSTLFNNDTNDNRTISNELCKLFTDNSVNILNLGVEGFDSELEIIKLLNLYKLSSYNENTPSIPNIAIFYDGYNDSRHFAEKVNLTGLNPSIYERYAQGRFSYSYRPLISLLSSLFRTISKFAYFLTEGKYNKISRVSEKVVEFLMDKADYSNPILSNFKIKPSLDIPKGEIEAISYIHDQRILKSICEELKISCYVYLQPILATKDTLVGDIEKKQYKKLKKNGNIKNAKIFYTYVRNNNKIFNPNSQFYNFHDISRIYNNEKKTKNIPIFYDYGHMGFYSSNIVAEHMYKSLSSNKYLFKD